MQQVTSFQEIETFINQNGEMVIGKNSKNNVIIMSMEEYRNNVLNNATIKKLLKSEEDIENGRTRKATEVIKELRAKYNLKENNSAKRLMTEVMDKVLNLKNTPELYMKIGKKDKLKREYYRMVVKNYIILYTVDFDNKKVYISQMIYGKRNYLKQ